MVQKIYLRPSYIRTKWQANNKSNVCLETEVTDSADSSGTLAIFKLVIKFQVIPDGSIPNCHIFQWHRLRIQIGTSINCTKYFLFVNHNLLRDAHVHFIQTRIFYVKLVTFYIFTYISFPKPMMANLWPAGQTLIHAGFLNDTHALIFINLSFYIYI